MHCSLRIQKNFNNGRKNTASVHSLYNFLSTKITVFKGFCGSWLGRKQLVISTDDWLVGVVVAQWLGSHARGRFPNQISVWKVRVNPCCRGNFSPLNQSTARQPLIANSTTLSDHRHPIMHFSRVLDDITPLRGAGLVIWWFLEHVRGVGLMMPRSHRPRHTGSFVRKNTTWDSIFNLLSRRQRVRPRLGIIMLGVIHNENKRYLLAESHDSTRARLEAQIWD